MNDAAAPAGLLAVVERAQPLADRFLEAGHRIFFVGGVVRDHILERSRVEQDIDVTTDARPPEIKALVHDLAQTIWAQGERFGTIGCVVGGQIYEITTHRAERYDPASRKPIVSFGDRLEEDLARRDFTVNAMAVDLHSGELVDPLGGRADLRGGVLRTPLDPEISFTEDPLRMLRAARFHAGYALVPVPALTAAIESMVDRIAIVSGERIRDELQKLSLLDAPGAGLALLAETGLLGRVLPSLASFEPQDAARRGEHMAAVAADPAMRWAALLGPEGVTAAHLGSLKFSARMSREVAWFASAAGWVETPGSRASDAVALRRAAAGVPSHRELTELYDWVGGLREVTGRPVDDLRVHRGALAALLRAEPDLGDPLPIFSGEAVCALLGIDPGPDVGVALRWLRDLRIEEGPIVREEAAERLRRWWLTRGEPG